MICSSTYLTKLIETMLPRLLFAIAEDNVWSFFSLPQFQNSYETSLSSSLVAAAEFHVKLCPANLRIYPDLDQRYFTCAYASGLIYFHGNRYEGRPLVCNPNTGLYAILPYLHSYRKSYSFFGFDPIDKQYKVLFMGYYCGPGPKKILTLGRDKKWRKIKCSLRHDIKSEGVRINGVLYYLGDTSDCCNDGQDVTSDYVIVCFDVRSEKFTFVDVERFCRLINYKGKLAMIFWEDDVPIDWDFIYYEYQVRNNYKSQEPGDPDISEDDAEDDVEADTIVKLHVWVQEDAEKQEWSKYAYTVSDDKFFRRRHVSVAGVNAWGEIVFAMGKYTSKQPFYVYYFNPEKNTFRRIEIKGLFETFKKLRSVWTFVNHGEDLNARFKTTQVRPCSIWGFRS